MVLSRGIDLLPSISKINRFICAKRSMVLVFVTGMHSIAWELEYAPSFGIGTTWKLTIFMKLHDDEKHFFSNSPHQTLKHPYLCSTGLADTRLSLFIRKVITTPTHVTANWRTLQLQCHAWKACGWPSWTWCLCTFLIFLMSKSCNKSPIYQDYLGLYWENVHSLSCIDLAELHPHIPPHFQGLELISSQYSPHTQ